MYEICAIIEGPNMRFLCMMEMAEAVAAEAVAEAAEAVVPMVEDLKDLFLLRELPLLSIPQLRLPCIIHFHLFSVTCLYAFL